LPTAARILASRTRFIQSERTSVKLFAVKAGDSGLSLFAGGHLDKTESLGLAADFVLDDPDIANLPERLEGLSEVFLSGAVRQVAYVDIHLVPLLGLHITVNTIYDKHIIYSAEKTVILIRVSRIIKAE